MGGHGLFATAPIAAGEVVLRLAGRIVGDDELAALIDASDAYVDTFWLGPDENVVLPPGTDAHFGNHSCEPSLRRESPMTFAAGRDLEPGDELTVDYASISGPGAVWSPCACGATTCRGTYPG
jgi:SET domain-containing protein